MRVCGSSKAWGQLGVAMESVAGFAWNTQQARSLALIRYHFDDESAQI